MTVSELIANLCQYDLDKEVRVCTFWVQGSQHSMGVTTDKDGNVVVFSQERRSEDDQGRAG
ncbi:MAG: hypothetical protein WC444_04460 [Candidatus Paceibacterota bacterium]